MNSKSLGHQMLVEYSQKLFSTSKIKEEVRIPELNLYIDVFIHPEGIALEFDGNQHYHYNSFFHKDESDFLRQRLYDKYKYEWCIDNGIKMVRFDDHNITYEQFVEKINSIDYPTKNYVYQVFKDEKQNSVYKKAKQARKDTYQKYKKNKHGKQ